MWLVQLCYFYIKRRLIPPAYSAVLWYLFRVYILCLWLQTITSLWRIDVRYCVSIGCKERWSVPKSLSLFSQSTRGKCAVFNVAVSVPLFLLFLANHCLQNALLFWVLSYLLEQTCILKEIVWKTGLNSFKCSIWCSIWFHHELTWLLINHLNYPVMWFLFWNWK